MLRIVAAALALLVSSQVGAADSQVELKTSMGSVVIELFLDKAPATVENFLRYVKDGHFDGTVFHRVIPKFMVQVGGFTPDFGQKPTRKPVRNEADNDFLDFRYPTQDGYGYCVFGKVVKGKDAVNRIVKVRTGPGPGSHQNVPVKPVIIERARLLEPSKPVVK